MFKIQPPDQQKKVQIMEDSLLPSLFKVQQTFQYKQPFLQSYLSKPIQPPTPKQRSTQQQEQKGSEFLIKNSQLVTLFTEKLLSKTRFQVIGVLGSGSFGKTYEVFDICRNYQHFAMKVCQKNSRKLSEAKLNIQLKSPTINRILDGWLEDNKLHIVSELGKCNLKELLDNYIRLDENTFWALAADISEALIECQRHNIVHLDIKPSNILIWQPTEQPQNLKERMQTQSKLKIKPIEDTTPQSNRLSASTPRNINDQYFVNGSESQQNIQFSPSTDQNQTPDIVTYEQLQSMNGTNIQLSGQFTGKYVQPLQQLNVSVLRSLRDSCLFQLIDFGVAQQSVNGVFTSSFDCGDNAYVDLQLIQQQKIDYDCDSVSLGLTLYECITGVIMPTNGPLFNQIRSENLFQNLDESIFGINVQDYMQGKDVIGTPNYSREVFQAIYDLIVNRMKIQDFREKYEQYFDLMQRSAVYQIINDFRGKNENISESQIQNRIFVLNPFLFKKYLSRRKRNIRVQKLKRIYRNSSQERRLQILRHYIKNNMDFIKYGAYFMNNKNRMDYLKFQLQSTVTQIEYSGKPTDKTHTIETNELNELNEQTNNSISFSDNVLNGDEFFREESMNLSTEKTSQETELSIKASLIDKTNYLNRNNSSEDKIPLISSSSKIINIFEQLVGVNTFYKQYQLYQTPTLQKNKQYHFKEDKTANLVISENVLGSYVYQKPLWYICFNYNILNILISFIKRNTNNNILSGILNFFYSIMLIVYSVVLRQFMMQTTTRIVNFKQSQWFNIFIDKYRFKKSFTDVILPIIIFIILFTVDIPQQFLISMYKLVSLFQKIIKIYLNGLSNKITLILQHKYYQCYRYIVILYNINSQHYCLWKNDFKAKFNRCKSLKQQILS